jgi:hypothetical protein
VRWNAVLTSSGCRPDLGAALHRVLEVETGAENAAGAGDHRNPQIVAAVDLGERRISAC